MSQESNRFSETAERPDPPETAASPHQTPTVVDASQPVSMVANPESLKSTRTGLYTVYVGICTILFGIVVLPLLLMVSTPSTRSVLAVIGTFSMIGGIILGSLVVLVGQIFCVTIPRESGAKGYVQATVGMQALSLVFSFGSLLSVLRVRSGVEGPALGFAFVSGLMSSAASLFFALGSVVCFLFFLKHAALHIHRPDLAKSATTILKMVVGTIVVFVVSVVGMLALEFLGAGFDVASMIGTSMLTVVLLGLITFVRFGNLVGYLARAILPRAKATPGSGLVSGFQA